MKKNKVVQNIIAGVVGLLFAFITIVCTSPDIKLFSFEEKEEKTTLENDYYAYINKDILDKNELEEDEEYWSLMFTETQEKVDDKVEQIIKEIISKKDTYEVASDEYKICKLYESVINQKNDLSKINTYMQSIDNSNSIEDLMNNIAKINNDLSLGILINPSLQNDYKDNTKTIVNIAPCFLDYNNIYSDYYTNPLYSSYIAMYIEYDRKIFELYGYSKEEAKDSVRKISKFYTEIANNSKDMEELAKVQSYYNIVEKNELKEIFSNIDINIFLKGFDKNHDISIVDIEQAKKLNSLLVESNLDTLKELVKLQLLQNYASYADVRYFELMNELQAKIAGTEVSKDTVEDYAIDLVASYFDDKITKEFVKKYANEESIELFKNIIQDIIKQYKVKIKNNSWLSASTKEKALVKLEKMKINVGYPSNWEEYSKDYILGENLLDNVVNMNKTNISYYNNAIKNKEEMWLMSALTVNAYYNLQDNSINFPIALLEYELYSKESSYYQIIGSLGTIIAHEITHAFDNNGALFDEKGNLNNWWTESDYNEFEKLQKRVVDYYSQYKVNDKTVNGKLTVSENIADLGAVSCIVDIAKNKGATDEQIKEIFEAYAKLWASEATEEYTKLLIIMDTHAPDSIRVNAVLSATDEFYRIYGIAEENKMYKNVENRVKVW